MRFKRASYAIPLLFAAALALAPEAGCVQVPSDGKEPALATHVQDWRDEVIYQLIVDRFFDGDVNNDFSVEPGSLGQYQGGDWKGIEDHLDYLQALGITTLWISPIIQNVDSDANIDAYHGYWQQDLTQVNPHFGDSPAFDRWWLQRTISGSRSSSTSCATTWGRSFSTTSTGTEGRTTTSTAAVARETPSSRSANTTRPGSRAASSLSAKRGRSGRAPIMFFNDPTINRLPPQRAVLASAGSYHGIGPHPGFQRVGQRTLGDFTGGLKDLATELARGPGGPGRRVRQLGGEGRLRRLPHRYDQARG